MTLVWYAWRASRRQMWRTTLLVMIIGGLLGTVALGAVAAARRTDSAYGRYLHAVNASDVMVDVPGPFLPVIKAIERAPGTASGAAWIGVAANPVIRGKVDDAFLTNSLTGSLDGEFYRQDKVTVLAGTMPPPNAADEIVITQSMVDDFRRQGVQFRVGDRMTWQLYREEATSSAPRPADRATFRIAAIVVVSPALADQFDDAASAFLTPAATQQILSFPASKGYEWAFGWATLRLRDGDACVPALRRWLNSQALVLATKEHSPPFQFTVRRLAVVKQAAQEAIEPAGAGTGRPGRAGGARAHHLDGTGAGAAAQPARGRRADAAGAGRQPPRGGCNRGRVGRRCGRRCSGAVGGRRHRRFPARSRRPGPETRPGPRRGGRLACARRRRRSASARPRSPARLARLR